jgi:hypothetical protein
VYGATVTTPDGYGNAFAVGQKARPWFVTSTHINCFPGSVLLSQGARLSIRPEKLAASVGGRVERLWPMIVLMSHEAGSVAEETCERPKWLAGVADVDQLVELEQASRIVETGLANDVEQVARVKGTPASRACASR